MSSIPCASHHRVSSSYVIIPTIIFWPGTTSMLCVMTHLSSFRMQPLVYEEHLNWHLMHLFHTCKSGCFLSRCFLRVPILFTSLIGNTHTHKPKIHSFWFCWNLILRSKVWFWPNINTNNVVIILTLIPKLRFV